MSCLMLLQDLLRLAQKTYELDVFVSLAVAALTHDFCQPEMTMGTELLVEGGFHPLQGKATCATCPPC